MGASNEDITEQRFSLNPDRTIDVPIAPDPGVTIDPAALERTTLARLKLNV